MSDPVDGARQTREVSPVPFTYPFPRPSVTCDVVAFTMRGDDLAVLLIQRKDEPFKGCWALPGGFVNENEALERAAARELEEETGITGLRLEQLGAFGDPGRDPRGHTITIAYVAFLAHEVATVAGDDAADAEWHAFRTLGLGASAPGAPARASPRKPASRTRVRRSVPPRANEPVRLAFDHARIITRAYRRLLRHLDDPVRDDAFDLVPPRFTLAELRRVYEVILGRRLAPATIKKHLVDRGLVVPVSAKPAARAAMQLYRWNRR